MRESVDIKFKESDREKGSLPSSVPKEMVAFANTEGGELYIGVRDDGSVVGVADTDDVMTRISNIARDTILPNIMPFIQIRPVEIDGKQVIKTTVAVGAERPYYLAKEGLTSKGVFVRRGSACIPLSEAGIREMIMETSGKSFEECRSLNQNLTFNTLREEMSSRNIKFGDAQMKTLKMIGNDGLYTNLALLLSDQCPYTIKVAIFQGTDNAVFRDRRDFYGSLLKQLDDVYRFLDFYNKTEATFSGLRRNDQRDYPEDAVREALLNSIIHRDYLFSGSTIINMFDDHVEFVSLGGLVRGISMDAVFMGVSQSRNQNLAAVFYRLGLVESYGTGIKKIMRLYKGFHPQPVFRAAEGGFTVEIYNRNEKPGSEDLPHKLDSETVTKRESNAEMKNAVYSQARNQDGITRKEAEKICGCGSTKAYKFLLSLCEEGLLVQQKKGRQTIYLPKE